MRGRLSSVVLLIALGAGCAGRDAARAGGSPSAPKPPPKPGSSITHSKMCSCLGCLPRSCCDGSADPEVPPECSSDPANADPGACGLTVMSCEPRCSERVYRVKLNQSCDEHRPSECC